MIGPPGEQGSVQRVGKRGDQSYPGIVARPRPTMQPVDRVSDAQDMRLRRHRAARMHTVHISFVQNDSSVDPLTRCQRLRTQRERAVGYRATLPVQDAPYSNWPRHPERVNLPT